MSGSTELPQRISGARIRLRRREADGGQVRYEVLRLGTKGAIGEVTLDFTGAMPAIDQLCIDESERGYGAGSETANALLRTLSRHFATVRAWAPPDRGLAVYFWVRMGFRPLMGEGPEGGLWFEQDLNRHRPARKRTSARQSR